ncbi:MAG: hypothetical protein JRD05_03880 [Deltaproteobacteria bacterium]|nr:hypothetical protein [Deltaproteobacteria bacterium]
MRRYLIIFWAIVSFVIFYSPCFADEIEISIKGIDDGVKTTKQQDYKEAVLFAKQQAIERAGVMIKSKTTVKNLIAKEDFIESKSEGILLPGYKVIDIGYTQSGNYQIVLIGKIKTVSSVDQNLKRKNDFIGFEKIKWGMKYDQIKKTYKIVSTKKSAECFLLYTGNEKYEWDLDGRVVRCYILNDYKISDIALRVLFYISEKNGLILIKLIPTEENIYVLNRLELFVSAKFGKPIINKNGGRSCRKWGTFVQSLHWQCTFCTNVPHSAQLIGVLTRRDIMGAYNKAVIKKSLYSE